MQKHWHHQWRRYQHDQQELKDRYRVEKMRQQVAAGKNTQ